MTHKERALAFLQKLSLDLDADPTEEAYDVWEEAAKRLEKEFLAVQRDRPASLLQMIQDMQNAPPMAPEAFAKAYERTLRQVTDPLPDDPEVIAKLKREAVDHFAANVKRIDDWTHDFLMKGGIDESAPYPGSREIQLRIDPSLPPNTFRIEPT